MLLSRDSPADFCCLPYVVLTCVFIVLCTLCPTAGLSTWYQAIGNAFTVSSWFL